MNRKFFDDLYVNSELKVVAYRSNQYIHKGASSVRTTPEMKKVFEERIKPYWKKYGVNVSIDPQKFYSFGDPAKFDERYIPNNIWVTKIVPYYNSLLYAPGFQDKCLHNLFFPDMKRPETLVKNVNGVFYDDQLHLMTKEEAKKILKSYQGRFIVKPSVGSSQGRGIQFANGFELDDKKVEELFASYHYKNFVIQKLIKQHPGMAKFHEKSINTVRVISFLYKDEVHILSTVVRIGGGDNEVDNVARGGYQCNILPDGHLDKLAYTKKGGKRIFVAQDDKGMVFGEQVIPSFDEIIFTVKREAARIGHYRIIGWDIAVDETGSPVFIEYNCNPGQNQMTSGPTLGDLTTEVLDEVFGKTRN